MMNEKTKDKVATSLLYFISILVVLFLVTFIGYIIYKGAPKLNVKFLFGLPQFILAGSGIGPYLFNSFYLLIVTLIFTVPLGIGAGIYMAEYAKEGRILNFIRLCIDTMASLPSIVVGLFGMLVFVQMLHLGWSLLAGALAVTILNLPAMTRVSENALKAAEKGVKEASLGIGATLWQTIRKVILPIAIPQIITGIILASGRIFGEAAALIYTAGMSAPHVSYGIFSFLNKLSAFSVTRPSGTLAIYIWTLNSESIIPDRIQVADGAAAVLVIMVLLFNFSARIVSSIFYSRYSGKR